MRLFTRLFFTTFAALLGLPVGVFVWIALVLIFGYPSDTPQGTRIPSAVRIAQMNQWQGHLEFAGNIFIPLLFALLFALFAWRSSLWNFKGQ